MEVLNTNFMKILGNFMWSVENLRGNYGVIFRIIKRIVGELWSNFRKILRKIWRNSAILDNYQWN